MNKAMLASMLGMIDPGVMAASAALGPNIGRKARFGHYTVREENGRQVDRSERINFNRSKYIPGNGQEHRLGKANPECIKRTGR